ncbi:MAG: hypothetical protein DKM23_05855 [Candidatus Melainabacteria bacterium]|nr:MAG: hypothetical protein DKM23_05855 [Candidatus Melainabacteria bacterium]
MQVSELLEKLDNNNKNQLENEIVNMGSSAVPVLVEKLQTSKGLVRGVVAMSLIRIGEDSVSLLKEAASKNHDFTWVADYLINEIEGSKVA